MQSNPDTRTPTISPPPTAAGFVVPARSDERHLSPQKLELTLVPAYLPSPRTTKEAR